MPLLILLALLTACGPHELISTYEPPESWTEMAESARVVRLGEARLGPDEPPLTGDRSGGIDGWMLQDG